MTVLDWLLDPASDPAIRWQALRDLTDASDAEVAAERARVAHEGWGARLLALQADDGRWGGGGWLPNFVGTGPTLNLLRELGVDPADPVVRRAIALVDDRVRLEYDDLPFFGGEVEPCINGAIVASGAYYGVEVAPIVDRLLGEQMADGGWNCEQENGSVRGSFDTTINVLDGLAWFAAACGSTPAIAEAQRRAHDYLLDRHLFRRRSTSEVIDPRFVRLTLPTWWHYDILRGLDYLRRVGLAPDERAGEAIELLRSKVDDQGRWPIEAHHRDGKVHFELEPVGPSRWSTMRAMRILDWWDGGRA
jgi:hypothetical protein